MALPDVDTALGWRGRTVVDPAGEELGKVTNLYLEGESQRPAWAGIKRGLLRGETVVPLDGAEEADGNLRVPYERAVVEDAPDVDPDIELSEDDEQVLREHYGRGGVEPAGDEETDTAMTRSEEEVTFGKRVTRRAERVRLRKVVVHDEVTKTVPVRKEVIRLETDPPPDGEVESVEDVGGGSAEGDAEAGTEVREPSGSDAAAAGGASGTNVRDDSRS
jgi:hypothetical protein